jgi:uncharacterized protein YjbJ (UPF0337 family)
MVEVDLGYAPTIWRLAVNEDRLVGAGKELFGKGERAVGDAVGSDHLKSDGVVDQVSGAVRHRYGELKDVVSDVIGGAPALAGETVDQARRLARRTDEALYDKLGENRHVYVMAGAVALLAISILYAGRER